ncbi:MAG TPA: class I SAM-dependent methyltransferase [Parafilimonas sp.]|nr:class I SAM-dependent methyltransferase [Parafilimonas sp.]
MNKVYLTIVEHYEHCLDEYGDSHKGVDWPKQDDTEKRYEVMLNVIKFGKDTQKKAELLDFGCGAAHLLDFMIKKNIENINYSGLDISEKFISLSRKKFSNVPFYCLDILDSKTALPSFDYIIMNGVFTEKRELSFEEMWNYFCKMLKKIFQFADKGIAFNVMSKAVDWERDDLFHLPTDLLVDFLTKNLTRNFIIRNDYGLYEYTTYVYR